MHSTHIVNFLNTQHTYLVHLIIDTQNSCLDIQTNLTS